MSARNAPGAPDLAELRVRLEQAEARARQAEDELHQLLDLAPVPVVVLGPDATGPEARVLYRNRAAVEHLGGLLLDETEGDPRRTVHPEDVERVQAEARAGFARKAKFELEARLLAVPEQHRWFAVGFYPIQDERGRVVRWYVSATDIDERKRAEERLRGENIALRDEVDRASMFEEIVGASPALRKVLSRVVKVAPTDATVLVTGETGTGKELVARAIHRRSKRKARAFVSVSCAAIPSSLIASELFGHEKGAFTGATQRRLGRFEVAEGGTLFLDEIGELPAETQVVLLRVLQEHQFERVGGSRPVPSDVRVIAATNRDLKAATQAGSFRQDLYYRLSVFPLEVPPLRERREDIPLLVEYFAERFARRSGKSFKGVEQRTLDLLRDYPWPGNVRELQNVVERSVIVCEGPRLVVDESWLGHAAASAAVPERGLAETLASQERDLIESALAACSGRVAGRWGAASRLGLPASTLESRIKALRIDKDRFRAR